MTYNTMQPVRISILIKKLWYTILLMIFKYWYKAEILIFRNQSLCNCLLNRCSKCSDSMNPVCCYPFLYCCPTNMIFFGLWLGRPQTVEILLRYWGSEFGWPFRFWHKKSPLSRFGYLPCLLKGDHINIWSPSMLLYLSFRISLFTAICHIVRHVRVSLLIAENICWKLQKIIIIS